MKTRMETLALSKRSTAPLAPIPQKAAEPYPHVVVHVTEGLPWVPVRKVSLPPPQQLVRCGHGGRERAFRTRRGQPTQFLPHARERPRRGSHREIAMGTPVLVSQVPQRKAEKVEALLRRRPFRQGESLYAGLHRYGLTYL